MTMLVNNLQALLPELLLGGSGLLLLLYAAFRGDKATSSTIVMSFAALLGVALTLLKGSPLAPSQIALHGMFIADDFGVFVKIIVLAGAALSLLLAWRYLQQAQMAKPEYAVLVLFATLGMMLMISAHDMMALYVGLELQSLSLYVLAAFRRDHATSSEAGLKYFVLGALSSGMLLYGISLIYGFTGSTNFSEIGQQLSTLPSVNLGLVFGLVFICAALAFKVSAVPFHMWTPDVYEGAPTPVTAFFAAAPKVAALALFSRLLLGPLAHLALQWTQILVFAAIASMLLGAFAGLVQSNIKRLFAYSSIGHVGYALVGLVVGGTAGIQALLIYLAIYFINVLGSFAVVLCLRRQGVAVEKISDLSGISKTHPLLALGMVIFMFSLAGVPPLAGFFGKYFVFLSAVNAGYLPLAIIGMLTSAVSAYYYLKIIKVMYFDELPEGQGQIDAVSENSLRFVTIFTGLAILLFVLMPSPLIDSALVAARSLITG